MEAADAVNRGGLERKHGGRGGGGAGGERVWRYYSAVCRLERVITRLIGNFDTARNGRTYHLVYSRTGREE